jgi:hypothetical protein
MFCCRLSVQPAGAMIFAPIAALPFAHSHISHHDIRTRIDGNAPSDVVIGGVLHNPIGVEDTSRRLRFPAGMRHHALRPGVSTGAKTSRSHRRRRTQHNLSPRLRWLFDHMWQEWKRIETGVQAIIERGRTYKSRRRPVPAAPPDPSLGPLVFTAAVAAIGNSPAFRRGHDFAAWVGVVRPQYSTGGTQ